MLCNLVGFIILLRCSVKHLIVSGYLSVIYVPRRNTFNNEFLHQDICYNNYLKSNAILMNLLIETFNSLVKFNGIVVFLIRWLIDFQDSSSE